MEKHGKKENKKSKTRFYSVTSRFKGFKFLTRFREFSLKNKMATARDCQLKKFFGK